MASSILTSLALTAGLACFGGAAAAQGNATAAAPAAQGQYKIAVVDRKAVFDQYGKKKVEWDQLEGERKKAEDDLNARLNALQTKKKAYESEREKLTDEQRTQRESELNKELRTLQADGDNKQNEINRRGESIIKKVTGEINTAIQTIGKNEGYHLILEADTAISSVVYYAPPLDITGKVIEYVNSHAGTSAPAAAPTSTSAPAPRERRR